MGSGAMEPISPRLMVPIPTTGDWRARVAALGEATAALHAAGGGAGAPIASLLTLVDGLAVAVGDGHAKVSAAAVTAVEALAAGAQWQGGAAERAMAALLPALAAVGAFDAFDLLLAAVGEPGAAPAAAVTPMVTLARHGPAKARPAVIERLAGVVDMLPRGSAATASQVSRVVVPLLMELVETAAGSGPGGGLAGAATAALVAAVVRVLSASTLLAAARGAGGGGASGAARSGSMAGLHVASPLSGDGMERLRRLVAAAEARAGV